MIKFLESYTVTHGVLLGTMSYRELPLPIVYTAGTIIDVDIHPLDPYHAWLTLESRIRVCLPKLSWELDRSIYHNWTPLSPLEQLAECAL